MGFITCRDNYTNHFVWFNLSLLQGFINCHRHIIYPIFDILLFQKKKKGTRPAIGI